MVYCGLVRPHRSVGGDQVTLTAPRVDIGTNENMNGAPTAAGKSRAQFKTNKHNYTVYLPFRMTFVYTYENIPNVYMYACANGILGTRDSK